MAIRNKALTVNFLVWDTVNNRGKTADAANITLKVVKDGAAPVAVTNAVVEPDPTNLPGIYQIALTQTEMDGDFICVSGKSASTGAVVYPVFMQTERGDLNTILGLINQIKAKTDALPADPASITGVNSSRDSVLAAVSANEVKIDAVSASVDTINSGGVKLNAQGKTDVRTEAAAGLTQVNLSELTVTPGATPTLSEAVMLQYMALRNKTENTENLMKIYKDNGTVLSNAYLSDAGNVFTKDKLQNP